ncbi:MAG: Diacylglycerol kinase [Candidatus Moranbacteria bacterium GW2011_GWE1_36_7]|nr:MAG: Diacylglycerol kinase [Candidatus Moranbacteria bacterium GW2011_GWD2_36_12]KKQ04837.1 MAG: Diacylglycerol kinase [Candidatus Moranbacteria bacterium GW2011_GWE2_36_40]KKQ12263.1 MAG: Diacylglycerol kinase [Candidatus Moranbacteria bacterium GW2011_GWE1_36_7]
MREELRRFKRSLGHALDGIKYAVSHEKNFRIELSFGVMVLALIFILKVKNWEAIILILMIMWVFITELTNTVFERVVDILKPRIHPYARLIKDLMAAVVLISAIVSVVVGIIIFYPYFRELVVMVWFF